MLGLRYAGQPRRSKSRRVSYNGNTSAFQADAGGSIPPTRSKHPALTKWVTDVCSRNGIERVRACVAPRPAGRFPLPAPARFAVTVPRDAHLCIPLHRSREASLYPTDACSSPSAGSGSCAPHLRGPPVYSLRSFRAKYLGTPGTTNYFFQRYFSKSTYHIPSLFTTFTPSFWSKKACSSAACSKFIMER